MNQNHGVFQAALEADLGKIHKNGIPERIEAGYAPAMTELAAAITKERYAGEADYYSQQVEHLLRQSIGRIPTSHEIGLLPKTKQRHEGLEKLFGIAGDRGLGLNARRENAAKPLGYKDAETLRRGEVTKRPLLDVILDELVSQMLVLANEHDFVSVAQPDAPEPRSEPLHEAYFDAAATLDSTAATAAPSESTSSPPTSTPVDRGTMLKRRLGWRWRLAAAIGTLLVLSVATLVVVGTLGSHRMGPGGWGPSRLVYDYKRYNGNDNCADPANPASNYGRCGASTYYPVFNSFINTPSYGDERAFFDGYRTERPSHHAEDPVRNITSGDKIVTLKVYVDNMAQVDEEEPALTTTYNARVRIALPTGTAPNLIAYAYISAGRTVPVYDSVDLTSRQSFFIEYVPGSAVLWNRLHGHNQSYRLSDEIIGSEGALIGADTMNGVLPPSNDFSTVAVVELKIRAIPQP